MGLLLQLTDCPQLSNMEILTPVLFRVNLNGHIYGIWHICHYNLTHNFSNTLKKYCILRILFCSSIQLNCVKMRCTLWLNNRKLYEKRNLWCKKIDKEIIYENVKYLTVSVILILFRQTSVCCAYTVCPTSGMKDIWIVADSEKTAVCVRYRTEYSLVKPDETTLCCQIY